MFAEICTGRQKVWEKKNWEFRTLKIIDYEYPNTLEARLFSNFEEFEEHSTAGSELAVVQSFTKDSDLFGLKSVKIVNN